MFRFLTIFAIVVVLATGGLTVYLTWQDQPPERSIPLEGIEVPKFTMVEVPFEHHFDPSRGLPFAAGAMIDVDDDGVEEFFVGGGVRQPDALFVFAGDHFVNVADQASLVKQGDDMTLGAAVIDADGNGYEDLLVSRESGVWLYSNHGSVFSMDKLDLDIPPQGAPLGAALCDLNRDGHFDFFLPIVSRISMLDWLAGGAPRAGISPKLFLNNGDNTFTEITQSAGMATIGEALQAIFTDLDQDGLDDLTVLHADGTVSGWRNLGQLLFESRPVVNSGRRGEYMGMAVGDYDDDGLGDIFLTNREDTLPQPLLKMMRSARLQEKPQWALLRNSEAFTFRDVTERAMLSGYELGRGALFSDLNNDSRLDLLVSQNHPFWPPHMIERLRLSGRTFLQNKEMVFAEAGALTGLLNTGLGVTPLQTDFNGDGYPDIVHVNLNGRSHAFISSPGSNNYLVVRTGGAVRSLGAKIYVKTLSGETLKKSYTVGRGLCSDSTHSLFFGLADERAVDILVEYRDGERDFKSGDLTNTTVIFD